MKIYPRYREWPEGGPREQEGILVASDMAQEWLLPWWWDHYTKWNRYPVTWVDLGLSDKMRAWCRERGHLVRLLVADIFVTPEEEVAPEHARTWEEGFGVSFWNCRNAWFKKPSAFLQTPYQRTIWIDTDCEVRGSLAPLFAYCDHPSGIALREELFPAKKTPPVYNSGVAVYRWGLPLLAAWADQAFERSSEFMGDQDLLSQIIIDQGLSISELPDRYNRSRRDPEEGAVIVHWHGSNGKKIIESRLIQSRLDELLSPTT